MMSVCRVLIVDDSALVRQLLSAILAEDPAIEVVGTASDPYVAREKIKQLNPDVLTLDVEMPRMDGLTFLSNLMRLRPMPVVMISSLTQVGADTTLKALELGAIDFVAKPIIDSANNLDAYANELRHKVRVAARAQLRGRANSTVNRRGQVSLAPGLRLANRVIAIGASTGGTEAIREVLMRLPSDCPPVVVVQHIPAAFSASFATRLDQHSALVVCESQGNERLQAGHAYIAPGDRHLRIVRSGNHYVTRLDDSDPVNRHKPSVDVLFDSTAVSAGKNAIGILLTGMGKDGAKGLFNMRSAGAITLAQDQASCVVFGMPREAISIGAADEVVALDDIADRALARLVPADTKTVRAKNS